MEAGYTYTEQEELIIQVLEHVPPGYVTSLAIVAEITCRTTGDPITKDSSPSVSRALDRLNGRCLAPLHRVLQKKRPAKKRSDRDLVPRREDDMFLLHLEGILFNAQGVFINKDRQIWTFRDLDKCLPPAKYAFTRGSNNDNREMSVESKEIVDGEETGESNGVVERLHDVDNVGLVEGE